MNIYDFDNTVYSGDSTVDFYFFALKKDPSLVKFIPWQILSCVKYIFKIYDKTKFKENFYCFLKGIKNIDLLIEEFWESHIRKIKKWYLNQKRPSDIIISASPDFLLQPVCSMMKVNLIASVVDKHSGVFSGKNCHGMEKVRRLKSQIILKEVSCFYSDCDSDIPLACIAQKAFRVNKNKIMPW